MFLETKNQNYCAYVVRVSEVHKVDGLDNLVAIKELGFNALVSKNVQVGDLMLIFPAETKLHSDFCHNNNLFRDKNLNADQTKSGFFDNTRVKAIKFKKNISNAFATELKSLSYLGIDTDALKEGDNFNLINGVEICKKYYPRNQSNNTPKQPKVKVKKEERITKDLMPEHVDTAHYLRCDRMINDDTYIIVTHKLHGSSARFAHQICKRKLSWAEKALKFLGFKIQEFEYDYLAGSRRVIKDASKNQQHYYKDDVWTKQLKRIQHVIPKGVQIFGEILGWCDESPLQQDYTYNVPFGEIDFYIYRIANVNEDGVVIDWSWDAIKKFCEEKGLKHVPEIYRGPKSDFIVDNYIDKRYHEMGMTQCVPLSHPELPDEGVVIRIDNGLVPNFYKVKGPIFYLHEGIVIDKGGVDIETQESGEVE